MLWRPADSTTDGLQLLVWVSNLVAVKTHDVYLINFLPKSPRLVAWDLGKDQEKGAVFLHGPSLWLWGTKTSVNATENSLCPIPQGVLEWVAGRGEGSQRVVLHRIRSLVAASFSTSTTEIHMKRKL